MTRRRSLFRAVQGLELAAPVMAFIGASMILYVAVTLQGSQFFSAISWFKWDSFIYQQIVHQGYVLGRCAKPYVGVGPDWCGDAAWFPGYPGVMALLEGFGLHPVGTAVLVSWVFDLATLILVWNVFLRHLSTLRAYLGLIFVACCPGGIYMRAAFPMSLTVFLLLLVLWALRERRWAWAGVAGGAAAACYPTACLLAPLGFVWILVEDQRPRAKRLQVAVGYGALSAVGLVGSLSLQSIESGYLKAYLINNSHYQHGFWQPFHNLWPLIHGALTNAVGIDGSPSYEALMVAGVVITLLVGAVVLAVRGQLTRWDGLLVAYALMYWLFPATQANESYWRTDTLLIPIVLLAVRMRREVLLLICLASVAVFPVMAWQFFGGALT